MAALPLERVLAYVEERSWDAEVIAIKNRFTRQHTETKSGFADKYCRLQLLEKRGKPRQAEAASRTGMLHAQGEILLGSDADPFLPDRGGRKALLRNTPPGRNMAVGAHSLFEAICRRNGSPFLRQPSGALST